MVYVPITSTKYIDVDVEF